MRSRHLQSQYISLVWRVSKNIRERNINLTFYPHKSRDLGRKVMFYYSRGYRRKRNENWTTLHKLLLVTVSQPVHILKTILNHLECFGTNFLVPTLNIYASLGHHLGTHYILRNYSLWRYPFICTFKRLN